MSVDVINDRPTTPMYSLIWDTIRHDWEGDPPWKLAKIKIVTDRLGILVYQTDGVTRWFHVCYPRKLAREIRGKLDLIKHYTKAYNVDTWNSVRGDIGQLVSWRTAVNWTDQEACGRCKKELNKKERIILKLAALGRKL